MSSQRGRDGCLAGAPGSERLDDGSPMQSKGRQWIPDGKPLVLKLPGGGGYGDPRKRDRELVEQYVRRGYITEQEAREDY